MIKSNNFMYVNMFDIAPPNLRLLYDNFTIHSRYLNLKQDGVSLFIPSESSLYCIPSTNAYIRGAYSPLPIGTQIDGNLYLTFASNYSDLSEDQKNSVNDDSLIITLKCTCGAESIYGATDDPNMHSDWCDINAKAIRV